MIIIFVISFIVNIPSLYKNTNHIHIENNSTKTIISIVSMLQLRLLYKCMNCSDSDNIVFNFYTELSLSHSA